jgi:hypothetical protein
LWVAIAPKPPRWLGTGRAGWLAPEEVRRVLSAYGVEGPRSAIAYDADDAAWTADRIGYPVALKLVSREILHKSDVGGVFLRLADREGVQRAFRELERRPEARGVRGAMEGVLVQEMVEGGVETYVGVTQAPGFGAPVAFGISGVNIEIWRDVAFRVHPITDVDASDMLAQIRGRVLLDGFRGAPAMDKVALADTILRIDRLLADVPAIEELDINPCGPPGWRRRDRHRRADPGRRTPEVALRRKRTRAGEVVCRPEREELFEVGTLAACSISIPPARPRAT